MTSVDQFRENLGAPTRAAVDLLRSLIRAVHPDLTEHFKWNAPSFALRGHDRITLGLDRTGGVRIVLHRGAKRQDVCDFKFSDPAALATWPAADRGVILLKDAGEVESKREELSDLFRRWLAATG